MVVIHHPEEEPMDLPNLPPELALDEEPFSMDDLDSVLADAYGINRVGPEQLVRDATLDAETHPVLYRPPARWRITDDQSAEWAARQWREATDDLDEVAEKRRYWVAQIEGWAEGRVSSLANRARFMEVQLEEYALAERERTGGKRKTLTLPSATVRTRPQAAKPEVIDGKTHEFVEWAKENLPDLVRTKEEPKLSEFAEHLAVKRVVGHYVFHADLECGHHHTGMAEPTSDGPPDPPDSFPCDECEPDPIDGAPHRVVLQGECNPIHRFVVVAAIPNPCYNADRDPAERDDTLPETVEVEVPGLQVRPESVTAKVGR